MVPDLKGDGIRRFCEDYERLSSPTNSPELRGVSKDRPATSLSLVTLITKTFNNVPFVFRDDGWFNMTKAAQHFGKRLDNWMASKETQEYIAAQAATLKFREAGHELYCAVRGQGTWAHPKLAVFFARWLDVRFAVWCDAMIEDIRFLGGTWVLSANFTGKPEGSSLELGDVWSLR